MRPSSSATWGREIRWGAGSVTTEGAADVEIVGVVKDGKYNTLRDEKMSFIYVPYQQDPISAASARPSARWRRRRH
jgi:hypothetical protein